MHGRLPILGYRIGKRMAYITDMLTMPEESYEQLHDLDVLVVNALRVNRILRIRVFPRLWKRRSVLAHGKLILSI